MHRKFRLLLVVALLLAQTVSLLHMAEHGFEKHQHDGKVCEIYLHHQQADAVDAPAVAMLLALPVDEAQVESFVSALLQRNIFSGAIPRAPPISLLS